MRVNSVFLLFALLLTSLVLTCPSMAQDPNKRLTQAEAVEDVNQLFSTLQRVHPDLLARVSLDDYLELKQQTLDGISAKLDKDGTIGIKDFGCLIYYAEAFFQDGHTAVQSNGFAYPEEWNTAGEWFPPFLLGFDNGRFVITASTDKSIAGQEIVSVDEAPIQEFLKPILDCCSGETLAFKVSRFAWFQAYWYNLTDLCSSARALVVVLRDGKGNENKRTVKTVSFADFQKLDSQKRTTKLQQLRQKGTQVHFLDSDRIAWLVYPAFDYGEDEKKKIGSIFQEIKAKGSQELIIDLRNNMGGISTMGDLIFSYLYDKSLRHCSRIRVKVSSDILSPAFAEYHKSMGDDAFVVVQKKLAGLEGMTITELVPEREHGNRPDAFFAGRIFLLVDNGTYSAAAGFTATFRDYGVGEILGYETGGLPITFGDRYDFRLKNSGIDCSASYKQYFNSKPRPGDDEHGIIPDIPMTDELLRPYQNEDDPVLAYTLDHIKKTRRSP